MERGEKQKKKKNENEIIQFKIVSREQVAQCAEILFDGPRAECDLVLLSVFSVYPLHARQNTSCEIIVF